MLHLKNQVIVDALTDISHYASQPQYTETRTNGSSWGGAQTTSHSTYEEHTITEGEAFTNGKNWSTAWANDSSHASNLTFNFSVVDIET